MFDRFNDPAKKVMKVARAEAIRLGAAAIGPEHMLLAVLKYLGNVLFFVLREMRVDADALGADVESELTRAGAPPAAGPPDPGAQMPFTPAAKDVLTATLEEAELLGHRYIGNEHLLLGLIRSGGQRVSGALAARGLALAAVRSEIRKGLGEDAGAGGGKT